jgi:hypothetical protein
MDAAAYLLIGWSRIREDRYQPSAGSGVYRLPCGCLYGKDGTQLEACPIHPET